MAVQKIDYENKIGLQNDENVPNKNKVTDNDMNEIKSKVNNNADELTTAQQNIEDLQEGQGTASSDITNLKNRVTTLEGDNTKNKQDIANKVDKVEGKGLSTEDYTTAEKEKLAELSNYDDTEIKKDIQDLKDDVSDIKSEQETQNDLLQRTQSALINITTPKSSNINVKDSSDLNAKVDVYGISRQETREGYNLFNNTKTISNVTYNSEEDKWIFNLPNRYDHIAQKGTFFKNIKANTNYTLYFNILKNTSSAAILFNLTNTIWNNNIQISAGQTGVVVNNIKTREDLSTALYDLWFSHLNTITGEFEAQIMLLEGTYTSQNIPNYEQYGASPSPEFPSEIENVGDNINLFNKEEFNQLSDYTVQMEGAMSSYKGKELQLKPNTKYAVSRLINNFTTSGSWVLRILDADKVTALTILQDLSLSNDIKVTITTGETGIIYIAELYATDERLQDFFEEVDIKIEEGEKATSYSEYGCGSMDITVCNKNIFNSKNLEDTSIITVNEDGSIALANNTNSTGYTNTGKKLKELCKVLKVGDVAHLKLITTFSNKGIYLQGSNSYSWTNEYSKTITEDMLEDVVIIYGGYQKTDTLQIQITKDSLEDYVPHEEQLITFPLQEGQRLMDGDKFAGDGIHHVRKQVVLDGTENWMVSGNSYYLTVAGKKLRYELTKGKMLCTHFKETEGVGTGDLQLNEFFEGYYVTGNRNVFFNYDNGEGGVEGFKSYLSQQKQAGTPVILEYELEEEEIESYTEEQQEAYNQLQNVLSYKPVTNVFTDKALLVFKYIADTQTWAVNLVKNEIANTNQQILELAGGN